jgi:hypothetical protein
MSDLVFNKKFGISKKNLFLDFSPIQKNGENPKIFDCVPNNLENGKSHLPTLNEETEKHSEKNVFSTPTKKESKKIENLNFSEITFEEKMKNWSDYPLAIEDDDKEGFWKKLKEEKEKERERWRKENERETFLLEQFEQKKISAQKKLEVKLSKKNFVRQNLANLKLEGKKIVEERKVQKLINFRSFRTDKSNFFLFFLFFFCFFLFFLLFLSFF